MNSDNLLEALADLNQSLRTTKARLANCEDHPLCDDIADVRERVSELRWFVEELETKLRPKLVTVTVTATVTRELKIVAYDEDDAYDAAMKSGWEDLDCSHEWTILDVEVDQDDVDSFFEGEYNDIDLTDE